MDLKFLGIRFNYTDELPNDNVVVYSNCTIIESESNIIRNGMYIPQITVIYNFDKNNNKPHITIKFENSDGSKFKFN